VSERGIANVPPHCYGRSSATTFGYPWQISARSLRRRPLGIYHAL